MDSKKQVVITCILCPYGCRISVEKNGEEYLVSGNRCKQGKEYALIELTNAMRTLTTTVKTIFPDFPRLAVKTNKDVKLSDIFRFMEEINRITITKRLKPGDVIRKCLLNQDIDLIATDNMLGYPQS